MQLPYDPAKQSQGMYPRHLEICLPINTHAPVFKAALFTMAEKVETTQMPINWWTDKPTSLALTKEYYLAIKKNEIQIDAIP